MKHEYTPQEALDLVIRKVNNRHSELAGRIRAAVNAGTDVQEIEQRRARDTNKPRSYRRTVPYSPEQALQVAVDTLQAHFVEQPLFINSLLDNMVHASLGPETTGSPPLAGYDKPIQIKTAGTEKAIEIELHTETQLVGELGVTSGEPEVQPMPKVSAEEIREQQSNLNRLRALFDFREGQ
jgi:hypothetical protein